MSCAQCTGVDKMFNERTARRELRSYRKKGPRKTTRLLLEAIVDQVDSAGYSFLDIGGGVGAIQQELLEAGASGGTSVDASSAYLKYAEEEAKRRGTADQVNYRFGDFVEHADEVQPANVVTMDRVLCCYDEVEPLLTKSSEKAQELIGVVYPKYTWYNRVGSKLVNGLMKIRRSPFRTYIHSTALVEDLLSSAGFSRTYLRGSGTWQIAVFERSRPR